MKDNPLKYYFLLKIIKEYFETAQKPIGKTLLQKIVFFTKELKELQEVDYDFQLYTYGPFSSQIEHDLEFLEFNNYINIQENKNHYGYQISVNKDKIQSVKNELKQNETIDNSIKETIDKFHNFNAKDIGLLATLYFVEKYSDEQNQKEIISYVHKIKPLSSKEEIEEQYKNLNELIN